MGRPVLLHNVTVALCSPEGASDSTRDISAGHGVDILAVDGTRGGSAAGTGLLGQEHAVAMEVGDCVTLPVGVRLRPMIAAKEVRLDEGWAILRASWSPRQGADGRSSTGDPMGCPGETGGERHVDALVQADEAISAHAGLLLEHVNLVPATLLEEASVETLCDIPGGLSVGEPLPWRMTLRVSRRGGRRKRGIGAAAGGVRALCNGR